MVRLILLVATFFTTYFVGVLTSNTRLYPNAGFWYSIPLMLILLGHEMGHYLTCRWYGVRATLPIFLPMPFPPFGTLGAVIMMRSRLPTRRAIFDIGLAGPLAGLALSIPAIIVGLKMSKVLDSQVLLAYYAENKPWIFFLGTPRLFDWLQHWIVGPIPRDMALDFHPLAYAGWVGLFVTALNLLPVGQLDGGHVLYAVFGRRSILLSSLLVGSAFIFTILYFLMYGTLWVYTVFIVLVFLLTRRFPHPPPINDWEPIGLGRKVLGILAIVLLVLCFTWQPFQMVSSKEALREWQRQEQEGPGWTPEDILRWTRRA